MLTTKYRQSGETEWPSLDAANAGCWACASASRSILRSQMNHPPSKLNPFFRHYYTAPKEIQAAALAAAMAVTNEKSSANSNGLQEKYVTTRELAKRYPTVAQAIKVASESALLVAMARSAGRDYIPTNQPLPARPTTGYCTKELCTQHNLMRYLALPPDEMQEWVLIFSSFAFSRGQIKTTTHCGSAFPHTQEHRVWLRWDAVHNLQYSTAACGTQVGPAVRLKFRIGRIEKGVSRKLGQMSR